jgi:hypothetical protein
MMAGTAARCAMDGVSIPTLESARASFAPTPKSRKLAGSSLSSPRIARVVVATVRIDDTNGAFLTHNPRPLTRTPRAPPLCVVVDVVVALLTAATVLRANT